MENHNKLILIIGFPKTGTSSFNKLFTILKFKTYHQIFEKTKPSIGTMINTNYKNGDRLLNFLDNDINNSNIQHICVTQMDVHTNRHEAFFPQIDHLKQLYEENPNAVFILNKRDPLSLLQSLKKWMKYDERFRQFTPHLFKHIEASTQDDSMLQLIQSHYKNVVTFFENKPKAKFVVFDIENDQVTKLSPYIDLGDITTFPHINKTTGFKR